MLEFFCYLLVQIGYEVCKCEHPSGAVCAALRSKPDLIVADIRMPLTDSLAMVNGLKEHPETLSIPIVAVTESDAHQLRQSVKNLGCDECISKPVDARIFAKKMSDFINQNQNS